MPFCIGTQQERGTKGSVIPLPNVECSAPDNKFRNLFRTASLDESQVLPRELFSNTRTRHSRSGSHGTLRVQIFAIVGNQATKGETTPLLDEAPSQSAEAVEGKEEKDMADLPQWAKGDEEGATNKDLEDKLVEEGTSKPDASEAPETGPEEPADDGRGMSKVLCFFRFLAALTVIMALVVIGTNIYIIYENYSDIQGEFSTSTV